MDRAQQLPAYRLKRLRHIFNLEMNQTSLAIFLIMPSLILTLILTLFPIIQTAVLSVHNTNLARPGKEKYVGFDNYVQHLSDDFFWEKVNITSQI